MVTNHDRKSFGSCWKNSKSCSDNWHHWWCWSMHFGTHFAERFCMSKSPWMLDPTHSREMPSCSVIDLAKILWSSKISTWIWSIISGEVTVLGRLRQGASQVEKSPWLNWGTQFLTVAYNGACSPNVSVRMALISLGALPCRKKKTWWQFVSPCCWNHVRRLTCFLSAPVTRKDLQFVTWTDPSFQQHYKFRPTTLGSRWAKDLSAPPHSSHYMDSYVRIISEKDVERIIDCVMTWCSVPVFCWRDWR